MYQPDLFRTTSEEYFFSELNKTQNSMNRQFRALFAIVTELKKDYIELKEQKKKNENVV